MPAVLLAYEITSYDIRMGKLLHRPGLAIEALQQIRIAGQVWKQDLDGYVLAGALLAGFKHRRHCPLAQLAEQLEIAQLGRFRYRLVQGIVVVAVGGAVVVDAGQRIRPERPEVVDAAALAEAVGPRAIAQAATGALSPEAAVKEAEDKYKKIWEKWAERKLI